MHEFNCKYPATIFVLINRGRKPEKCYIIFPVKTPPGPPPSYVLQCASKWRSALFPLSTPSTSLPLFPRPASLFLTTDPVLLPTASNRCVTLYPKLQKVCTWRASHPSKCVTHGSDTLLLPSPPSHAALPHDSIQHLSLKPRTSASVAQDVPDWHLVYQSVHPGFSAPRVFSHSQPHVRKRISDRCLGTIRISPLLRATRRSAHPSAYAEVG